MKLTITILLAALVLLTGCESPYVDREQLTAMQKQLNGSKQQLEEAKQALEETKQALQKAESHRYQVFTHANRTWRLDTNGGGVCLLLAPPEDWKKPEVKAADCNQWIPYFK